MDVNVKIRNTILTHPYVGNSAAGFGERERTAILEAYAGKMVVGLSP